MLLERFGLWDARHERVSTFSRGMQQRLALCRALLHEPTLLLLDEPYSRLDAEGAELLDRELAELRGRATFLVATHDPERLAPLATGAARAGELRSATSPRSRARTCCSSCARARPLPAMLLFVLATLVVFHFALPGGPGRRARDRAALGRDRLHVAARARRGRSCPSASSACSTGSSSRRSTGARSGSAKVARRARRSSPLRRGRGAAGLRALLRGRSTGRRSPRSRSPTSASARVGTLARRRWRRPAARASCSCRSSSCRSRSRSSSAASGARVADEPARYLGFLGALRRRLRDTCVGEL